MLLLSIDYKPRVLHGNIFASYMSASVQSRHNDSISCEYKPIRRNGVTSWYPVSHHQVGMRMSRLTKQPCQILMRGLLDFALSTTHRAQYGVDASLPVFDPSVTNPVVMNSFPPHAYAPET